MLAIEDSVDNVVQFTIDGKVDTGSLEAVAQAISEKVAQYGKVRLYAEVHDMEGYNSFSAFLTDAQATLRHYSDFEKVAIVTNEQWLGNLSDIANLINPAEIKQFALQERKIAKHWVAN